MDRDPQIVIFIHSTIYGGVEVLITRFAQFLDQKKIKFLLITRKNSRIAKQLAWANQIDVEEIQKIPESITHIFIPNVCTLKNRFGLEHFKNAKAFSLIVHPSEIFSSLFPCVQKLLEITGLRSSFFVKKILWKHNSKVCFLLDHMISHNGLAAIDGATLRGLRYFYPEIPSERVPLIQIPSTPIVLSSATRIPNPRVLHIGYLGRMDAFKFSAIGSFINEHLKSGTCDDLQVTLHFVGEGDHLDRLARICRDCGVHFLDYGFKFGDQAITILRKHCDFAIAMGTASLDLAGAGIPTIIIDPAHRASQKAQNKFRFVHELEDFTFGEFRDSPHYREGLHNFTEVIKSIKEDKTIAKKGVDYINENHNPTIVFEKLYDNILQSNLKIEELTPLSNAVYESYRKLDLGIRKTVTPIQRFLRNLI